MSSGCTPFRYWNKFHVGICVSIVSEKRREWIDSSRFNRKPSNLLLYSAESFVLSESLAIMRGRPDGTAMAVVSSGWMCGLSWAGSKQENLEGCRGNFVSAIFSVKHVDHKTAFSGGLVACSLLTLFKTGALLKHLCAVAKSSCFLFSCLLSLREPLSSWSFNVSRDLRFQLLLVVVCVN